MAEVNRYLSDEEVMKAVLQWVDVLVSDDYDAFGAALGYSFEDGTPAECIRRAVADYRSPELYPGVDSFSVTDWREARGGNSEPRQKIIWYEPNASMLAGAISIDLPLNGRWSDLQADFVLFDRDPDAGFELRLEEIYSWKQRARENA